MADRPKLRSNSIVYDKETTIMRNFRNARKLQTESMGEADVLSVIEPVEDSAAANIGEVDKDDQEVLALLGEGEELAADSDLVEGLEDQVGEVIDNGEEITNEHAETLELVTESIASHWYMDASIQRTRKMKFESFRSSDYRGRTKLVHEGLGSVVKGAWNTFSEWVLDLVDSMKDTYAKYLGAGQAFSKFVEKQSIVLDSLGEAKADAKVKTGYQKHFMMDGRVDVDACLAIAKRLTSDSKGMLDWAKSRCENSQELVAASFEKEEGRLRDKVKRILSGLNNDSQKAFGKKVNRKLAPMGPKGSNEIQGIYALPGNSYIQTAMWEENFSAGSDELKFTMQALRYISDGGSLNAQDAPEKTESPVSIDRLKTILLNLEGIAENLSKIETSHKDIRKALSDLAQEAKSSSTTSESEDKAINKSIAKYSKKLTREAVLSARHSILSVTGTYKSVGAGIVALVKAHSAAYGKGSSEE